MLLRGFPHILDPAMTQGSYDSLDSALPLLLRDLSVPMDLSLTLHSLVRSGKVTDACLQGG